MKISPFSGYILKDGQHTTKLPKRAPCRPIGGWVCEEKWYKTYSELAKKLDILPAFTVQNPIIDAVDHNINGHLDALERYSNRYASGHDVAPFWQNSRSERTSFCVSCGKEIRINALPLPEENYISGSACEAVCDLNFNYRLVSLDYRSEEEASRLVESGAYDKGFGLCSNDSVFIEDDRTLAVLIFTDMREVGHIINRKLSKKEISVRLYNELIRIMKSEGIDI